MKKKKLLHGLKAKNYNFRYLRNRTRFFTIFVLKCAHDTCLFKVTKLDVLR